MRTVAAILLSVATVCHAAPLFKRKEARVRVVRAGVCNTDLEILKGCEGTRRSREQGQRKGRRNKKEQKEQKEQKELEEQKEEQKEQKEPKEPQEPKKPKGPKEGRFLFEETRSRECARVQ